MPCARLIVLYLNSIDFESCYIHFRRFPYKKPDFLSRVRLGAKVDEDEIKQVEMKKNFIFAMFGAHRRSPAKLNRKRRDSNFRQMTYKKFARVDKYSDFLGSV